MNPRKSEIYIDHQTKNRLFNVIKLYPQTVSQEVHDEYGERVLGNRSMTVDELATKIINEVIAEKFPIVLELERKLAKLERDVIDSMPRHTKD